MPDLYYGHGMSAIAQHAQESKGRGRQRFTGRLAGLSDRRQPVLAQRAATNKSETSTKTARCYPPLLEAAESSPPLDANG